MSWFSPVVSRSQAHGILPRSAAAVGLLALSLGLAACDDPTPWEQDNAPKQEQREPAAPAAPAAQSSGTDETASGGPQATDASGAPVTAAPPAADDAPPAADESQPSSPGEDATAPSPTPTSPETNTAAPSDTAVRAKNVKRDQRAMLASRTMVAAIEGCRAGRESYLDCDTAEELGGATGVGKALGEGPGKIKITASQNGFRVTAYSRSGAKFTVARGPSGDRFRCTPAAEPGACTASRSWSW